MSAINAALATIDEIGAEGEMDANAPDPVSFDLDGGGRSDRAARRQADLPAACCSASRSTRWPAG